MRLAGLYLRSRRAGWSLAILALLALGSWLGTEWLIPFTGRTESEEVLIPMLTFATLVAGCVIGASAQSPFGDAERTVARPLPPLRFGHLAGLLLLAAPPLVAALLMFELADAVPAYPLPMLLRNLAGFAGLVLLAARVLGARLSWILPVAFGFFAWISARKLDDTYEPWAWQMQPGTDALSWTVALILLVAGLAVVYLTETREPPDEAA